VIEIVGSQDVAEYRTAQLLRKIILNEWPDLQDSAAEHVTIVVAAKCFGCAVQDIDLVVIGNLRKPRPLPPIKGIKDSKYVLSFIWTIEVKSHSAERVSFPGGKVVVPYHGGIQKDATEQAFKQLHSLRDYIKRNLNRTPFITSLVWLENVSKSAFPNIEFINIVGSDSTWSDFLVANAGPHREWLIRPGNDVIQTFPLTINQQYTITQEICTLFSAPQPSTPLDRKRLERITRRVIDDQQYAERLGSQLLLFRGRGGTGKTITLIRLAIDLHLNLLKRVLFLTYNVALVADIKRTLSILQTPVDSDGAVVQVRTVQSFMLELMRDGGIISAIDKSALDNYDQHLNSLYDLISAFSAEDSPAFDFVFIDEAQDWPERERDIIFLLYGPEKTVVADGVDQLVRSSHATDWTARIGNVPKQVVPLRRSLRLKHGLASFANALAEEMGLTNWSLQANRELSGGKITVLVGSLRSLSQPLSELLASAESNGNQPVDSLVCVPFTTKFSQHTKHVVEMIGGTGFDIWDGTDDEERRSFATSVRQMRVVTYESCRGLEGWNVYCLQLDRLYDQKLSLFDGSGDLLQSQEDAARAYAASWLMIPVTRAIDHLVLHVEAPDHPVAEFLKSSIASLGNDFETTLIES
jgi:hypothetical protein